ncbi:hypothetical protein N665_0601s0006 [Sinapis alba]|nr:hypothetical protein N665_0601s0006 [Sinapis alba]
MVAISMYRGNLHKVPDVPRRWTMPDRNLSYKQFKSLLHRRKRALSHLSLNFNPNPNPSISVKTELVTDRNDASPFKRPGSSGKQKLVEVKSEEIDGNLVSENKNGRFEGSRGGSDGGDLPGSVMEVHEDATNDKVEAKEVAEEEKEQKEVDERLQVLNAKKHNLVQVLKQILNAEEELKRRSSITPPSLPLHVDVSNDSGGNNAGTHSDDVRNHNNAQTPTVLRLCGASSSSESPLRRAAAFSQHNMAPHPSRWSPRLVPSQPGNPSAAGVTVSASGTNYIASSPSPAASGGTSVFRETRLQSPWN